MDQNNNLLDLILFEGTLNAKSRFDQAVKGQDLQFEIDKQIQIARMVTQSSVEISEPSLNTAQLLNYLQIDSAK